MYYPIVIEPGSDETAFGVIVPDITGCFSAGDSFDEAIHNAEDAILLQLEEYLERGMPVPSPSQDVASLRDQFDSSWVWALAHVDLDKLAAKSVRVNISIPERILHSIDSYAAAHGETRSEFLRRAAITAMADQ